MVKNERKVLEALALDSRPYGEMCVSFAPIMQETGLDRRTVRRYCRSLKRKGLAEFYKGLWSYDDRPAGAGYCITYEGMRKLAEQAEG